MSRYYYKCGNNYLSLKNPLRPTPNYMPITEEQFIAATQNTPTESDLIIINKLKLIDEKKALLNKYREDVEQVDLFGMSRDDYAQKKAACAQLVLELRELERGL